MQFGNIQRGCLDNTEKDQKNEVMTYLASSYCLKWYEITFHRRGTA